MAGSNKQKVKEAALALFNANGVLNVRLQHISDASIVSLGNLNYHFRTKELLIESLWQDMLAQRNELLAEFRVLPLFEDMERLLRRVFQLQQAYLFFYIDTPHIIQAFPAIATSWQKHQDWQRATILMMVHFNVSRGVFRAEPQEAYFAQLADVYSQLSDTWAAQQRSLGLDEADFAAYRRSIWTFWSTLFTDRGWQEYRQLEAMIAQAIL